MDSFYHPDPASLIIPFVVHSSNKSVDLVKYLVRDCQRKLPKATYVVYERRPMS